MTDFERLLANVALIDPGAAEYLRNNYAIECTELDELMVWGDTPQGHWYWSNIHKQLHILGPYPPTKDKTTSKERVALKMKLLWNTSNYVKTHPEQAYS